MRQITTQVLIGDAVSLGDAGSRYSDVDQAIQRFNNRDIPARDYCWSKPSAKIPRCRRRM